MDLLNTYSDDNDNNENITTSLSNISSKSLISIPIVIKSAPDVDVRSNLVCTSDYINNKIVHYNPTIDILYAPTNGPVLPNKNYGNTLLGNVEKHNIDDFNFHNQYHTYQSYGYAANPTTMSDNNINIKPIIGDIEKANLNKAASVFDNVSNQKRKEAYEGIRKRKNQGDGANPDTYLGPWAPYEVEELDRMIIEKGMAKRNEEKKLDDELKALEKSKKDKEAEEDIDQVTGKKKIKHAEATSERTIFSGESVYDYQGHTYMHPPGTFHPKEHTCYVPKKEIHTYTGHTKGVSAIRWFPTYGHLLLSCAMDGSCKLWDANSNRKCLRSYIGHVGAVRDIQFSNDGKQFLSSGYDKYIKLWDVETGQCITRFTDHNIGLCLKFYPENNNEFICGMKSNQILQWDVRESSKPTQKYEEHLGPVNSLLFVDQNRRFVSTSDDKKIFFWDYGIPVVTRYIAQPHLQSIVSTALHPEGQWLCAQSMDNTILCYGAIDKASMFTRKKFAGHYNSGFSVQVNFSSDGQFVVSGDGSGQVYVWDWKTTKVFKKLAGHDQVVMGVEWHPIIPSQLATCSWDGTIKIWE